MLLLPLLALTGCTLGPEELIVGRWKVERAVEQLTVTDGGMTESEMPGYEHQVVEFMEGDVCMMTDRGDTVYYFWSLQDGATLVLFREGWAEDYSVDRLDKERLVYSDSYTYTDTLTGRKSVYRYIYEHKKL